MLPLTRVRTLEAAALIHVTSPPQGFVAQPLRAGRVEVPPPCDSVWSEDWLLKNELLLAIAARYVCNRCADGRNEEEQTNSWIQWVVDGHDIDWFTTPGCPAAAGATQASPGSFSRVGQDGEAGPWLGSITLIATPPNVPAQKRHRDINLPGPRAQLTVQVGLTPLSAVNGPLALRPGSHVLRWPGFEVVPTPPPGSVVLYDSFIEHRGAENSTAATRLALYLEYEMRGIVTGYKPGHFGDSAERHTQAFRRAVDPLLQQYSLNVAGVT